MTFLKAEWRKLAIANYAVDPGILAPHVPPGTELDIWRGKAYVSLIGFMFLRTRVLGVPVQSFEIDVDFGANYGPEFAHLNDRAPDSVMLAEGSEITVEGKRKIRT